MKLPARIPRATYRVQLHRDFNFEQFAHIVPYLHDLGISDAYFSPIFLAPPGSQHGYDVCDHNQINPELGGREGLNKISALLRERDMGMVIDFVPNHMGIEGSLNWRWMDVLENGRLSRYARHFSISSGIRANPCCRTGSSCRCCTISMAACWRTAKSTSIIRTARSGSIIARSGFRFVPSLTRSSCINSRGWRIRATPISQKLDQLAGQFRALPKPSSPENREEVRERKLTRDRLRKEFAALVEDEKLSDDLEKVLAELNGDPKNPESFDRLHQLLEEQNYRLAYWKTGTHEINYRRFFAIDTLVGVRMGVQDVFEESHRLLKELVQEGTVTGVRIDHVDGLWNPAQYLQRLAALTDREGSPTYSLVEKILTEKEDLPADWMTHGTTGYDFAGSLINLLIASKSENEFTRIYREFAGISLKPDEQGLPDQALHHGRAFPERAG